MHDKISVYYKDLLLGDALNIQIDGKINKHIYMYRQIQTKILVENIRLKQNQYENILREIPRINVVLMQNNTSVVYYCNIETIGGIYNYYYNPSDLTQTQTFIGHMKLVSYYPSYILRDKPVQKYDSSFPALQEFLW